MYSSNYTCNSNALWFVQFMGIYSLEVSFQVRFCENKFLKLKCLRNFFNNLINFLFEHILTAERLN